MDLAASDCASLPLLSAWLRQAFGVAPAPEQVESRAALLGEAFERYLAGEAPERLFADARLRSVWEWLAQQPPASTPAAEAREDFIDLLDDV